MIKLCNLGGRTLAFTVCALFLTLSGISAQAQDSNLVTEVVVQGNINISTDAILAVVQTKAGAAFEKATLFQDRAAIEKMGDFSAVSAREESVPGGVRVVFEVIENPKISKIVITGNSVISTEKILSVMRSKEGHVYNINLIDQDVRAIADLYGKEGYPATVTAADDIDPETGILTLPILEYKVGKITFQGLRKTKPQVFEREMKTKPGQVYNVFKLNKDINRIYELDFLDVEKAEQPRREIRDEEGIIDVIVPVTEKKTGQVGLGLGYSSMQKLVGRVELSDKNFQGKGVSVDALYETTGFGSGGSWELGYYNPWFRPDHTSLSARVYNKQVYRFSSSFIGGGSNIVDDSTYKERRKGGALGFSRPLNQVWRGFLNLRRESVDAYVPPNEDGSGGGIIGVTQNGEITSAAITASLDSRDFSLDPAHGNYFTLTFEPGWSKIVGSSDNAFTKTQIEYRKYFSKGGPKQDPKEKRKVLAFRIQGSVSNGRLPFWEQYFLGGAERLRGYREDRFWGNNMIIASAEYRIPVTSGLGAVAFVDFGDAWGNDYLNISENLKQSNTFKGHLGYGAGIRVMTPFGNIRFDYGIGDEGARTHFSIGQAF